MLTIDRSGLIFGRPPFLGAETYEVPQPDPSFASSTSYQTFLALCPLCILFDDINRQVVLPAMHEGSATGGAPSNGQRRAGAGDIASQRRKRELIKSLSLRLEDWRRTTRAKIRGYDVPLAAEREPGVCRSTHLRNFSERSASTESGWFACTSSPCRKTGSLRLLDLYCAMVLAREDWNCTLAVSEANAQDSVLRQCLDACANIASFLESLRTEDINGYWSPRTPFDRVFRVVEGRRQSSP